MVYKTDYIVVSGYKEYFERELNRVSELGYIWCGNMNTNIDGIGVFYSQLLSRSEEVKE